MMPAVSNIFGSVMVRLALIFGALATMTAAAIAISWMVFQTIATNMETLTESRLPELGSAGQIVSVADRVRGLLSDILLAETGDDIDRLMFKKTMIMEDLKQQASALAPEQAGQLDGLIVDAETAIIQIMAARRAQFASSASVDEALVMAAEEAKSASDLLDQKGREAFRDVLRGSELTTAAIDDTLTRLVDQDFTRVRTVLAIRAEMNLLSGLALALSQSEDAATSSALIRLATESRERLPELTQALTEGGEGADVSSAVAEFQSLLAPVLDGSGAPLRADRILSLRQSIDTVLTTTLDENYERLLVSGEQASAANGKAISDLLQKEVSQIRTMSRLQLASNTFMETILFTVLSRDAAELGQRNEEMQAAAEALKSAMGTVPVELQDALQGLLSYANPENGIFAVRKAALDAHVAEAQSAKAAADSVRQIAVTTGEFASNAQSRIGASAVELSAEVQQARLRIQSIGLFSLAIVVLAPVLIWLTVTRPLNRVTRITERLAQGDLSEIEGLDNRKGEIGRMAEALKIFRTGALERIEMQEAEKKRDAEMQEAERAAERAKHEAEMRAREAEAEQARQKREREAEEKAREDRLREEAEQERKARAAEQELVVGALAESLKRLSGGDLTHTIDTAFPGSYEALRQDYNAAIGTLADLIRQIGQSSGLIDSGSAEIASSSLDLSRRTENAAATLEETAAALSELTASVSSAARGAAEATETVDTVKRDAETSHKVMQDAVAAMGQIESSSSEIAKIVEVIDSIAFQTNLLALNAGVEAARAGDAGRGFAVVASEVRILAHRCSDAADQINKLISDSTGHVQTGVSLMDNTSDALETILRGIQDMAKNVSEIAVSSQEQSNGISEINVAVEQLDRSTQQNAAMFEETTAASQSLTDEAGKLAQLVAGFRVGEAARRAPGSDDTDAQVA